MKKIPLILLILFQIFLFSQEEILFETTWEVVDEEFFQIILLKDYFFATSDDFKETYHAYEVVYDNGKILTKDSSWIYYYEINNGYMKYSYSYNDEIIGNHILRQVTTSNDIKDITKFKGVWVGENESNDKIIFYGNFMLIQFDNIMLLANKFSYNENQIILLSSIIENTFINYVLEDNILKLTTLEGEIIIYHRN